MSKKQHKPKYLGLLVLILILFATIGTYFYSLKQIEIDDVKINQLEEITTEGFKLTGDIILKHNGFLPAEIDRVEYFVTLKNKTLAKGNITEIKISPKETKNIPLDIQISWTPSIDTALELLKPGQTNATIHGEIYVIENIVTVSIPFEETFNLEQYIEQFAKTKVESIVENIKNLFT